MDLYFPAILYVHVCIGGGGANKLLAFKHPSHIACCLVTIIVPYSPDKRHVKFVYLNKSREVYASL